MKDEDGLHQIGASVGAAAQLPQEAPALEDGYGPLAEAAGLGVGGVVAALASFEARPRNGTRTGPPSPIIILQSLKRVGIEIRLTETCVVAMQRCLSWLVRSGGSAIPDDFEPATVIKYEPVLSRPEIKIHLKESAARPQLQLIGEGAYAQVFSFVDPDYDLKFAVKRAKKNMGERDLHRFR